MHLLSQNAIVQEHGARVLRVPPGRLSIHDESESLLGKVLYGLSTVPLDDCLETLNLLA
jgi:hypothetical protein